MLALKAFDLIKELERASDTIPPFNADLIRQVLQEINAVFEQNHKDALQCVASGQRNIYNKLGYRHGALLRNKRCLIAYLYNRLQRIKQHRWEFGPILPVDIKNCLCDPEVQWFNTYSKNLSDYMKSIGEGKGFNLVDDLINPPKSLYVEVRCLKDYGKYELEDGEVVLLKLNSQHYLPRSECEPLIRRGILQHIA